MDYMLFFICFFLFLIFILVSIAFFTLLERKILSYIQLRKGPNKVGYLGLIQPFSDVIKLFSKELFFPFMSNLFIYFFCPLMSLFISLVLWMCLPFNTIFIHFFYGILYIFCCTSISVYFIMLAGWSSNSNYSLLGSMRSVAQVISYEVMMAIIILSFLFLVLGFDLYSFVLYQSIIWFFFICFPLVFMLFISFLAETGRSPFDFFEGESELVSGFNIEYGGGNFAMIFMAEYSNIIFISFIFCLMFLGGNFISFIFYVKVIFIMFFFLWIRSTLARFRYDKLMYLCWKSFLPLSLNFFVFFFVMMLFNFAVFFN